ncbi:alpha/beta fold hydrolase [Thalassorhabdus alkalitolerans]|uniref:Alpha/beta fold hydrolase n=1 Tax=Thalassorhabdus alkalitolerans TaxID=2282697 RepID=A0ABW0YIR3_9BACI
MPYFHSNGADLYYESTGSGPPLMFLHPPAMGAAAFYTQREELSDQFQVITFDARGHGKSGDGGRNDLLIAEWAEDMAALADHLGVSQIIPCGYSSGANPALEFAISYPERTAGLILISGYPEVSTNILDKQIKIGIWGMKKDLRGMLAKWLAVSHTGNKKHQRFIEKTAKASNPVLLKNLYANSLYYQCTEQLPKIKCPVAAIYGANDYYIHYYQYLFYKYVRNIQLIHIQGIAHQIPTKKPKELHGIIRSFVAQHHLSSIT